MGGIVKGGGLMPKQSGVKQIASNKKAFHDYYVLERVEAGRELAGTEGKSRRGGL
jgi:SsrA-binding protein